MKKSEIISWAIALGIFTLLFAFYIVPSLYDDITLSQRGATTTAQVVETQHVSNWRGPTYYFLVVHFVDQADSIRAARLYVPFSYYNTVHSGDAVQITYDPQEPTRARPANSAMSEPLWRSVGTMYVFVILILGLFIGGRMAIARIRSRRT